MIKSSKMFGLGLLALLCTQVAHANPVINLLLNDPALEAVKWTGTAVVVDSPRCKSKDIFGSYQFSKESKVDLLTLCVSKHDTIESLLDTIRHEAIHVGQVCRDGAIFKEEFIAKHASPAMQESIHTNYAKHHHAHELEAVVVASQSNQKEIADLIYDVCKSSES